MRGATREQGGERMRGASAALGSAIALALVAALASPSAASAQSTPAPPTVNPNPTREQVEQPTPQEVRRGRQQVQVDASGALDRAPCPLNRFDLQATINNVRFTGPNNGPLSPIIQGLLGQIGAPGAGQPVRVICDIRDRATAVLRDSGYVASVQIPPQTIETGELRLEVITARIVDVRVRGEAAPYRETLAARIEQLKALDPLNERDAERILLLASDVPGLNVQLQLRPANREPGEVVGDLEVTFSQATLLANVQNYGSRQLGREIAFARADFYGLTGGPSLTYVGGSTSLDFEEQQVLQFGHLQEVNLQGLTVGANFLHAWSRPDIGDLDLRSESLIGRLEIIAPLVRSVRSVVDFSTGLELIEQRTRVFGGDQGGVPLNRDKIRVLFARLSGGIREPRMTGGDRYSLNASLELRQGIDVFDATERGEISPSGFSPSRIEGDPTATVVRGEVEGVVGLGPIFSLAVEGAAQWANNPLLNFEEFSLGNLTFGRGYDPGANTADRAIGLRIEPRANVYNSSRLRADLFGFYDSVWIYNLDANTSENDRRLGSYGGGVRLLLPRLALLEVTYARPEDVPLLVPNARRAPDRLLVSLTLQYPPAGR
jgi:hemolysin activation/secretion protein